MAEPFWLSNACGWRLRPLLPLLNRKPQADRWRAGRGVSNAMTACLERRRRGQTHTCFVTAGAWIVATFIMIQASWIASAIAQPSAPQPYHVTPGDKISVTVFGQPDLSGEVTVALTGNLRLPIVGDIHAAHLTLGELEEAIGRALKQGYVRDPVVSAKITEFRPIYVLGMVRTPGHYPYREGLSVLGAIAYANGIGVSESQRMGTSSELLLAEERLRLLEVNRVALLAKRARLIAQQNSQDRIDFVDMSELDIDPVRLAQIRDGEQRAFMAERQASQQEVEALEKLFPRLVAELASLRDQQELELRQRDFHRELLSGYEQLMKTGLTRKSTLIEAKREEARIDENIARLRSEALKAELSIGDLQFRIAQLRNDYRRRVTSELRETMRSLLEVTATLPTARRMRATRAQQVGLLSAEQARQPAITVTRMEGSTNRTQNAALDFLLQPGDIVQVGSLFPPSDIPRDLPDVSKEQPPVTARHAQIEVETVPHDSAWQSGRP